MSDRKFPLFFDLTDRLVVVVGGGKIALRRVQSLLSCGARVLVVAPRLEGAMEGLAACGCICVRDRNYQKTDLDGAFLALACTDNPEINAKITQDARELHVLCNNAGDQTDCDFFFPAIVQTPHHMIGIVGDGSDHSSTRKLAAEIRNAYGSK